MVGTLSVGRGSAPPPPPYTLHFIPLSWEGLCVERAGGRDAKGQKQPL